MSETNQDNGTPSVFAPLERTALEELFQNAESNDGIMQIQADSGTDEVESDERARRLAKNREHARSCRARKKVMIQSLRHTVSSLSDENQDLKTQNDTLQNKVRALETTLVDHIQRLNTAQIPTNTPSRNNNPLQALLRRPDIVASLLKNSTNNASVPPVLPSHDNNFLQNTNNLSAGVLPPSNIPSTISQNLGMINLLATLQKSRLPTDVTQETVNQSQDADRASSIFNGQIMNTKNS